MSAAPFASHFTPEGAQFAWDSTSLKWASTCSRYYAFTMLLSYEGDRSVHLVFGGHYARALELFHKFRAEGLDHDEATFRVIEYTLTNTWIHSTKDGVRIPGTGQAEFFDSEVKSREALIRTIVWYLEENRYTEWTTFITSQGKAAVEFSFKIELSDTIIYSGHIDRVLQYGGDFFIQDQKTTSSTLTTRFFHSFDTDIQMSGYAYAGHSIYSIPIKGVMIDGAQLAAGYSKFMRGFTMRSNAFLNEWRNEMLLLIDQTQKQTLEWRKTSDLSAFRPNYTACGNYGGCAFRSVCSAPPSLRERLLRGNLSVRPQWNPLTPR
jgi:hypothetical protein